MNAQVAKFIVEELGVGKLYEEYSGRGMFSDTTTGIVVESLSDVYEAVFSFIDSEISLMLLDITENNLLHNVSYERELTDIELLTNELKNGIRWDNYGSDVIVY